MKELGIRKTHDNLKRKLTDYIKAQYFAENDLLMNASEEILQKKGVLYQEPYIEVTKAYKQSKIGFEQALIDVSYKTILQELIDNKLGVFNTPFIHQVKALEYFFQGENVLVTTGTGSGKTECFLWPILTNLIHEARFQPQSWEQEGIRALVLYPMNALVSDQLGRLRNIIGRDDDAYYNLISKGEQKRRARFGMYTGRTPYAGEDNRERNKNISRLIRENYIQNSAYGELKKIGRIPSKDLEQFADNLKKGLQITGKNDSELYTRFEMQHTCPDVMITNYSMLEYMLMRPIEQGIFRKTIDWINLSEENKLLLVIDEAHMYRGAPGGEVSLLIRRLMDRLGIEPSKIQCILTSASVPDDKDKALQQFACGLTGRNQEDYFRVVREELEELHGYRSGKLEDAKFYSTLSLFNLQSDIKGQMIEIEKLATHLGADAPEAKETCVQNWLYNTMKDNEIIKQIMFVCSTGGKALSDIAKEVFDESVPHELAERALEILLQLGIMAKSNTNKVLLGSKVHMLFRGIQGLYACVNSDCTHTHEGMGVRLGYITSQNMDICPHCGGRMFELMMDRRCGTIYLKTFIDNEGDITSGMEFLWSKRNRIIKRPYELHLWPIAEDRTEIFKIGKKRGRAKEQSTIGYLDSQSGMLFRDESHAGEKGFLRVLITSAYNEESKAYTFQTCPNCGKDFNKITPFVTRGNEPFANLVKEQFESQVPKDISLKNAGKKVLLFSDSRQRAATLARDMTIATDGDAGRQAIFMAQKLLDEVTGTDRTLDLLYYAFIKVVYDNKLIFFYGEEQKIFRGHLKKYEEFCAGRPRISFTRLKGKIGNPPLMFYQLLLRNISDSYRSYNNLGLAQVVLAESGEAGEDMEYDILEKVEMQTGLSFEDIRSIYNTWIQYLVVRKIAVFPEISDELRNSILSYERGGFGIDEKASFPDYFMPIFKEHNIDESKIEILLDKFDGLNETLQVPAKVHNRKYILGTRLELKTAENASWYKCSRCAGMSTYTLWGHCIYCGSDQFIKKVDGDALKRYALWTQPVFDAIDGKQIRNITTEEHTAQLSYKDNKSEVWGTTEKYELAFRNISLGADSDTIDVLSCTTTMEVGIDIGSLTSVGLRNVPPMRENYQQRAGRAGRAGAAVSTIVTYTENGPHDAWYFNHPKEIISGEPRTPWIDTNNPKLVKRHINLILLQGYLREKNIGLDEISTIDFFSEENDLNYLDFCQWMLNEIPFSEFKQKTLIPIKNFDWVSYKKNVIQQLNELHEKVKNAEFIYQPSSEDETRSNTYKLMDVLFTEGLLPNYSFPKNIVNFWIEDINGKVKESPERSIDIALSEYAPGRSLVVNKQTYVSGGLFNYYTKFQKEHRFKAAQPWLELEENKKKVQCCANSACGWFGVNEEYEECPLCGGELDKHPMIKPWGFTAREGRNIPETQENQEMSFASEPSYASMPSGNIMEAVGSAGYMQIENRDNQKLVIVNKGPEDKGFELCYECGAIEPETVDAKERNNRKRPYRIPYMKDDSMRCRHDYKNIYLGYEFITDMMVMEIKLNAEKLDLTIPYNIWLIPALATFSEALALAASRVLDVEFNDIKSGFRIRTSGNQVYADVYLYDSLSSGAGYANRVTSCIEQVLNSMKKIFTSCSCTKSCPNCLQHFGNQRQKENLDRFLGKDFLQFVRDGKLRREVELKDKRHFVKEINRIAKLHVMPDVVYEEEEKFYVESANAKRELMIYPSMCNLSFKEREGKIAVSDRMCAYGMSEVWRKIKENL